MPRKSYDISPDRLITAWRDARVADAYGRERRREMVRQYAGPNWAEQTDDADILLNLTSLYVQTISHTLIPKCPRFLLSTFEKSQAEAADIMQDAGNRELVRMRAEIVMRRCVIDALFGLSIWRVALVTPPESAARAWGQKGGEPMLSRIDREDFAYDSFAGDFSECAWMGHRYRAPLEAVKQDKRFRQSRKDIKADRPAQYDEYGVERIGVLERGFYGQEEIEDMVDLWEIYCPRHRAILTFITDGAGTPVACSDGKPLGEQPWIGPDIGPYGFIGYLWIPGNAMPKGPIQDLYQTDLAANMMYRKALAEADRNKEILLFQQAEDAKRIQQSNDGDTAYCESPDTVKSVVYGGQNFQLIYGCAQAMRELFDFEGGNLALLGGRSQQASTATQEKLLNTNAQGNVQDMQETTIRSANDMIERLCWFWWKHPYAAFKSVATLPGLKGIQQARYAFPGGAKDESGRPRAIRRDADFGDLSIRVDSFSLQPQSPQSRLAIMRQVWQQDVIPVLPLMAPQGVTADFNAYFKKIGQFLDDPDFEEILTIRPPPPQDGVGSPDGQGQPLKPASTERTVNRVNSSEATDEGQGRNQISTLLSGKSMGGNPNKEPAGVA